MRSTRLLPIAVLALAVACSEDASNPLDTNVPSFAISQTISPENAPQGTHLQTGTIGCTVNAGLSVTCSSFELAGVGHTNADVSLVANYTAIVDCFNPGTNPNNPIESHETTFSDDDSFTATSTKNGRLRVRQAQADPFSVVQGCPNPNWTPTIRAGSLTLLSFTYSLTFAGFTDPYILITGP